MNTSHSKSAPNLGNNTTATKKPRHFVLDGKQVKLPTIGASDLRSVFKLGIAVGYDLQFIPTDSNGLETLENALANIDAWIVDSQAAIGFLMGAADLSEVPLSVLQDVGFLVSGLAELHQAVRQADSIIRDSAATVSESDGHPHK